MKYMGSKSRIAKYIVPIIQECIDDNNLEYYIEPMVGGANLIDKIQCRNKIGVDIDRHLIALLQRVKNNLPLLNEVTKDFYNQVKNNKNNYEDWIVGNVAFLSSFNGKGFNGGYAKTGIEKTKKGDRVRDYYRESKDNILKQSQSSLFKDIQFDCMSYDEIKYNNISMIVFDPPYEQTVGYNNEKFNHDKFWEYIEQISKTHYVLVCEEQSRDGFISIWNKDTLRSLNPKNKYNKTEQLFTHKDGLFYKYWITKKREGQ